jgi:cytochrome c peroxidase
LTVQTYRRPLATANFHIAQNIGWHDQNTNGSRDVHAGLKLQADGNITGAQELLPKGTHPTDATLESIATYELGLAFAQQFSFSAGLLTACGAKGGPENLSAQLPVKGRFDLFDAWKDLRAGSCGTRAVDRKRAQIARGQDVFNNSGCGGCHNAANNGSNVDGKLFDIHASQVQHRKQGMPLYTLRNKADGTTHETTDPGRALRSGKWGDMDKFKVPSLRGISARAPYFHNGIAANLDEVVSHYEAELGFAFDPNTTDRADLIAFLEAL